ncbi:MAG: aminotransferase class V-fold PLP-dependent enzyme [Planctomycetota bacterium]
MPPFPLVPDLETMRRLGHAAVDAIAAHLEGQRQLRVGERHTAADLHAAVGEPLPEEGVGMEACLERFFDHLVPRCTQTNHPRFFAYIPGPGSYAGALGEFVAAATNFFVGTWLGGAAMAQLEVEVLDWLRQALALPGGVTGVLTSGGSVANLSALAAALATRPEERANAVVYTSSETHHSMAKAARILGVTHVRTLATDSEQRLSPTALAEAIADDRAASRWPAFVCANAGSTTTGSVDPIAAIADVCAQVGAWLHVDAAYGGAVALLPEHRPTFAGLERADSITLDPHKWLYVPFESGCLLTARVADLERGFASGPAGYLQDIPDAEVNFFARGPELTRGNRALKLWFLLRACGLEQIRNAIRSDLACARLACALVVEDPRLEVVTPPRLSVFTFASRAGEDATQRLMEAVLADGFLMLSSSRVDGRYVLRWCVANARTTTDDVRQAVARVRALLDR